MKQNVPSPLAVPDLAALDTLLKGCADPIRIRILNLLAAGELCVRDIIDILGLPQPTVSRHLAYLRRTGLVECTREYKFSHYRRTRPAHAVHKRMVACLDACAGDIPSLTRERARALLRCASRTGDAPARRRRPSETPRRARTTT